MKKVIDSSVLRSEALRDYLAGGSTHIAIITDHLAMELFKGDGETNVPHSLRILADFPTQVVVLRSTNKILKLKPKASGLHARLVDDEQTEGFRLYCQALFSRSLSGEELAADRARKQFAANHRYQRLSGSVPTIRATIDRLRKSYRPDELKALRKKEPLPTDFWRRFTDDLFDATVDFYRQIPGLPPLNADGIFYTLAFRYTLCGYARAIDWIGQGGYESASDAKLMNDYTDMAYSAYATFYDGLLTEDRKLGENHAFAARMMHRVFLKAHARQA